MVKWPTTSEFARRLSPWFEENGRGFPWRKDPGEFEIFLAEVLLQKTPASNVTRCYEEVLEKYPNFRALSEADLGRLSHLLEPLGLHRRRARVLKDIAERVAKQENPRLPSEKRELLSFKGMGPYTSSAILCFALNRWEVPVDTNVRRIAARMCGRPRMNDAAVIELFSEPSPEMEPRDFFWALLDLGALICRKRNPKCRDCPLSEMCESRDPSN